MVIRTWIDMVILEIKKSKKFILLVLFYFFIKEKFLKELNSVGGAKDFLIEIIWLITDLQNRYVKKLTLF